MPKDVIDLPVMGRAAALQSVDEEARTVEVVWTTGSQVRRYSWMRDEEFDEELVVELEAQLQDKLVTLELDDDAREWIAAKGYDPRMGARPMARIIQEHVKRPLAEELLFGSLVGGGHIRVRLDPAGDRLLLETQPLETPETVE